MEKFYPTKAGIEYAALTAQGKIIEFTKGKFGDGVRSTENITFDTSSWRIADIEKECKEQYNNYNDTIFKQGWR